jgi:hypothetical protein
MAEGVVECFEVIDIEEQEEKADAVATGEAKILLGEDEKAASIVELGELIAEGDFAGGELELLATRGEKDDEAEGQESHGGGNQGDAVRLGEDVKVHDEYAKLGKREGEHKRQRSSEAGGFTSNAVVDEDREGTEFQSATEDDEGKTDEAKEGLRGGTTRDAKQIEGAE